jgi:hypothetical protein
VCYGSIVTPPTPDPPLVGELILYRTANDSVRVEVLYESDTFWLDQKRLAELFGVDVRTISYHLKEVYSSGELSPESTLRKSWRVQTEGTREVRREIEFYNLDAIISVGYRVNSAQATQFRIWATQTLREFVIKGFVLDDERLKLNKRFGKDYFDELLDRIREIRASERRFKITDIYEQCSIDYDKAAEVTETFFQTVQNKLHWAVTGKTAAEIIARRADSSKPSMGLTTWKNAPKGKTSSATSAWPRITSSSRRSGSWSESSPCTSTTPRTRPPGRSPCAWPTGSQSWMPSCNSTSTRC